MYKDMIEKMTFHKENIIKGFIKIGVHPTDEKIESILDGIDLAMAYLNVEEVKSGKEFDAKLYTSMMESIHKDLQLLYKLLFELSIHEYELLNAFIDTHLESLEQKARFYKGKASQEVETTSLGKTVYYNDNSFNIKTLNNMIQISLGKIKMHDGSRISSFLNANNVDASNVIFSFISEDQDIKSTAYNYNQESIVLPGEILKKEYTYISEQQPLNAMTRMIIDSEININNKYDILAAKDKVFVKQFGETNKSFVTNRPTKFDTLILEEKSYIDFYAVGSKSITFRFNKKPVSTNFSLDNYMVSNLNDIHHFFIECDADFSFDFDLDSGSIYAIKTDGLITDNSLYFNKNINEKDFYIIEYATEKQTEYDVNINILNNDFADIDIQSIYIKEDLSIGGNYNDNI